MKQFLTTLFVSTLLFSVLTPIQSVRAQEVNCSTSRCARCDLCGYCQGKDAPESWESCRSCLYPELKEFQATDNKTIEIDVDPSSENYNNAPKTASGRYYTQLGCVNLNVSEFNDPAAAGSLVNFLLRSLVFPTVGGIAFIYLIYGTSILATSQNNPEKVQEGKGIVVGSIIGLVFTLSIILILNLIANDVLRIPAFGGQ